MKGGMAFVTFNPWGVVQVKIHRISAREMLLFKVKGGQGVGVSLHVAWTVLTTDGTMIS